MLLFSSFAHYLFGIPLFLLAVFLILLVLVQRGRGGGLSGALGGMGGQSAFGSKAGDVFTRITVGVAAVWLLLCVGAVKVLSTPNRPFASDDDSPGVPARSTSRDDLNSSSENGIGGVKSGDANQDQKSTTESEKDGAEPAGESGSSAADNKDPTGDTPSESPNP